MSNHYSSILRVILVSTILLISSCEHNLTGVIPADWEFTFAYIHATGYGSATADDYHVELVIREHPINQQNVVVHTTYTLGERLESAAWSDNGSHLAYVYYRPHNYQAGTIDTSTIYIYGLSARESNLIWHQRGEIGDLFWSPDHQYLFFRQYSHNYLIHIDTKTINLLPFYTDFARFSPDGEKLLFIDKLSGDKTNRAYLINIDGTDRQPLLETEDAEHLGAYWSPGGRYIALVTRINLYQIILVDMENDRSYQKIQEELYIFNNVQWSPDGHALVFESYDESLVPTTQIFLLYVQTGELRRLTYSIHSHFNPQWTPDGNRIVYRGLDENIHESIFCIQGDGSNPEKIIAFTTGFLREFAVSPTPSG
ncbi:MAG: PD40 domain-containing protein [Calditrichaeota bacterium]|nr:PD40 domain-containing protein [Calditrichota bacterium]